MPNLLACLISAIYVLCCALAGMLTRNVWIAAHKRSVQVATRTLETAQVDVPPTPPPRSEPDAPPPPPPPARPRRQYRGTNPTPTEPIKVTQVKREDGSALYAQNLQNCPLTLTIEFLEKKNVEAYPTFPHTTVLAGQAKIKLADIRQQDPYSAWRYRYQYRWVRGNQNASHDDTVAYRLPFEAGTSATVASTHYGDVYLYSFLLPEDTPVTAARAGKVVFTEGRYDVHGTTDYYTSRVNQILVQHDDLTLGCYKSLRPQGVAVQVGQRVEAGQLLGYSGNTGYSSYPQLTFFVMRPRNGKEVETFPLQFRVNGKVGPLEAGSSYTASE